MRAFIKKECTEQYRSGKLLILGIIFFIFGIMAPATAKLTPFIMDMYKETMEESGFIIGEIKVDALSSWKQYFGNGWMVIITIVIMNSSLLINEYQKGTLIQVVTKGYSRKKILLSKLLVTLCTWTAAFAMYTGVCFGYTKYFWSEDVVENLLPGILMIWLFGTMILTIQVFFGTMAKSVGQVLLGTGAPIFLTIILGYFPNIKEYLPTRLLSGVELCTGASLIGDFSGAIIVSLLITVICGIMSVVIFDKRNL